MNYATALKTDRMDATRLRYVNGTLEIGTAGMATVLATFTLTASAGSVTGDTWTLGFVSGTVSAGNTGTAAAAQIKTNGGTAEITALTVSTSGADINLNNTSINSGQDVTLSSATIQHAA